MPHRQQGLSLLELVVVISIIALLLMAAIDRLWVLQKDAEGVAMEQVLGSLRSALGMKFALYLVNNDVAGIRDLAGSNPMDVLAEAPKNYIGALKVANPESIPGGTWYFDLQRRILIYRVRNQDYFTGGLGSPARAGFVIRVVYRNHNLRGVSDRSPNEIAGATLVAVAPYRWGRSD